MKPDPIWDRNCLLTLKDPGGGRILPIGQEIARHFSQDQSRFTKFLDFINKHPRYMVVKKFFYYLCTFFRNSAETEPRSWFFWDRKSKNHFFFIFFITKSCNFISNLNDNCSQLSFEVYNVFVAQKLPISEFLIKFFSPGPWPLRRPPEAAISTSATSIGYQILAKDLNFHMRLCWLL